ncbi:MAG: DUF3098 domain-containing protein [Saprospiraceae bacterium]|jgi:hypothetical protein|nr:DUF3098 domain-containing protein [Saprospiraceae bacterium]
MAKRQELPKYNPAAAKTQTSKTGSFFSGLKQVGPLQYSKRHFQLMLGGAVLILIGFLLMSGGSMKDPNVWDESVIYSPIRITLAPIVILAGIVLNIYAVFKR